jgi:hypothetical protein
MASLFSSSDLIQDPPYDDSKEDTTNHIDIGSLLNNANDALRDIIKADKRSLTPEEITTVIGSCLLSGPNEYLKFHLTEGTLKPQDALDVLYRDGRELRKPIPLWAVKILTDAGAR